MCRVRKLVHEKKRDCAKKTNNSRAKTLLRHSNTQNDKKHELKHLDPLRPI